MSEGSAKSHVAGGNAVVHPKDVNASEIKSILQQVELLHQGLKGQRDSARYRSALKRLEAMQREWCPGKVLSRQCVRGPGGHAPVVTRINNTLGRCSPITVLEWHRDQNGYTWRRMEARGSEGNELLRMYGSVKPWQPVKDSNPIITLGRVSEESSRALRRILKEVVPQLVPRAERRNPDLDKADFGAEYHGRSSTNFAVTVGGKRLWLFRFLMRLSHPADLSIVLDLEDRFAKSPVVESRDAPYLTSLSHAGMRMVEWRFSGVTDSDLLAQHFYERRQLGESALVCQITMKRYHPEITQQSLQHFIPSLDALRSFAERLGRLHKYTMAHAHELAHAAKRLTELRDDLQPESPDLAALEASIDETQNHVDRIEREDGVNGRVLAELWREARDDLRFYAAEVCDALEGEHSKTGFPVLRDLHPHNVFCDQSGNCRMIFDLDGLGNNWTHEAATSFALHRFTREHVVLQSGSRKRRALSEAMQAFLEGYRREGPPLDETFESRIAIWIVASNLRKLQRVIARFRPMKDKESKLAAENNLKRVRAFAMFTRESTWYEKAVGARTRRSR